MQTSVDLQGPFYYSLLITIGLIALVVLPILIWIGIAISRVKKPKKKKSITAPKPKPVIVNKEKLRHECYQKIRAIEEQLYSGQITRRNAYVLLSEAVREFISGATGKNVKSLTLSEIANLNMPSLALLIQQFYHPEFAFGDATEEEMTQAFEDARKVVREWN